MSDNGVRQRLAAILAADAAGYSRLMSIDEHATMAALDAARSVFRQQVQTRQGRVIDTAGDSVLAMFDTATGAVEAAIGIQQELSASQSAVPSWRRLPFRIGIHLGDVIEKADGTIYGDGVNIAARLQALAEPGGVALSESIRSAVKSRLAARIEEIGERRLKNIADPVRVYRIRVGEQGMPGAARGALVAYLLRNRWRVVAPAALLVLAAAGGCIGLADSAHGARTFLASMLGQRPAPQSERATVAVMPFENQSGDPARDYFGDGITEDIIGALGRFPGLLVISRNTVQAYKGKAVAPQLLSRELGARYIVQGSLREDRGAVRVSVELSDAEKGVLLWSQRFDGNGPELFEIQDRIVRSIAGSLQARLTQLEQQRAFARPTDSLEAYDLVLRARALLERLDRAANRQARALLNRALELAPDYTEILTALGEAEVQRALFGWIEDPAEAMKRGEDLARRTLASPDTRTHARAHVLLGRIYSNLGQYKEAMTHAEQAIALNPSDAAALANRGGALLYSGRIDEAISALEEAMRFDPGSRLGPGPQLALAFYHKGRFQDSLALLEVLVTRFPQEVTMHAIRAAALSQLGRTEEARRAADQVRRLSPMFQVENFGTRYADPAHAAELRDGLRKAGL